MVTASYLSGILIGHTKKRRRYLHQAFEGDGILIILTTVACSQPCEGDRIFVKLMMIHLASLS